MKKQIEKEQVETRRILSCYCLHKWEEVNDYNGTVWLFFKRRIKIFSCIHCGKQIQENFPISQQQKQWKKN